MDYFQEDFGLRISFSRKLLVSKTGIYFISLISSLSIILIFTGINI